MTAARPMPSRMKAAFLRGATTTEPIAATRATTPRTQIRSLKRPTASRVLQLGQPWTVGQDDLAIDAAQVDAARDVEALVDEAGLQRAHGVAEVEGELSVIELERLAVAGEQADDDVVGGAVGVDPDGLERRAGGEAVGRCRDEALDGPGDRRSEGLELRGQLIGEEGVQVDVAVEGRGELIGHVLLHRGVVSQGSDGVHVAVGVGDLRSNPDADEDHRGRDDRHDEEHDRDREAPAAGRAVSVDDVMSAVPASIE